MTPVDATLHYNSIIRQASGTVNSSREALGLPAQVLKGHEHDGKYGQLDGDGVIYSQAGLAHMCRHPIDPRFLFLSPDLRDQLQNSKILSSPSDPAIKRENRRDVDEGKYTGFGRKPWASRVEKGWHGRYQISAFAMSYGVCLGGDDQRGDSLLTLTPNIAGDPKTEVDFGWKSHNGGATRIQRTLTLNNLQWVGPENIVDGKTTCVRKTGETDSLKRLSISGLDRGAGNVGKTDGSAASVDDGSMKETMQGHFAATGGNGTSHGRIARPYQPEK